MIQLIQLLMTRGRKRENDMGNSLAVEKGIEKWDFFASSRYIYIEPAHDSI